VELQSRFPLYDWTQLPVPRTLGDTSSTGSRQLVTGAGLIVAVTISESTGSGGYYAFLHDGTDTSGEIIVQMSGPTASSQSVTPSAPYIPFRAGLYYDANYGHATLSLAWIPLDQLT
jgi:hypothetical protein